MKTVKVDIDVKESAARFEPIIAIFYGIPLAIVSAILWLIASFAICIQAIHIVLLAKRNMALGNFVKKSVAYNTKMMAYSCYLTDERPPIMPQD